MFSSPGSRRLGGENHGAKLRARDISRALACFEADLRLLLLCLYPLLSFAFYNCCAMGLDVR
jgi:hypothetical protein